MLLSSLNKVKAQTVTVPYQVDYKEMYNHASGKYMRGDTLFRIYYHYYVVIHVENLNTGETKEICVKYNFLEGAIDRDTNAIIDEENLIFKFKEADALTNIGFNAYSEIDYINCTKTIDVTKLIEEWNLNPDEFSNKYSDDCQIYVAHKIFKSGIMVSEAGLTGQIKLNSETELMKQKSRLK